MTDSTRDSDLTFLQSLSERELCELVLIPLLRAMGFHEIRYVHGRDEHGKDIVFVEDSPLEGKKYYCAAVKSAKLSGSVSNSRSIRELHYQMRQALQTPFRDPFDGRPHPMQKVFVFTPFTISQAAVASIADELHQSPGSVIDFVDGPRLVTHVDRYLPNLLQSLPTEEGRYLAALCQHFMELPTLIALGGDKGRTLRDVYTGGRLVPVTQLDATLLSFATPTTTDGGQYLATILQDCKFVVVIADVGAGKTTLLQKLVLEIAGMSAGHVSPDIRQLVPLFVPLAAVPSEALLSQETFNEYLEATVRRETGLTRFSLSAAGRYLLLLDGFDEINLSGSSGAPDYATVARYIGNLSMTPIGGIVLTSRPTRVPELSAPFEFYSLSSFADSDVAEFVGKWFAAAPVIRDTLIERIQGSEELRLFCRTPLMLTIYCLLANRFTVHELPTRRSQIYDRMVDLLLGRWDAIRNVVNEFDSELKAHILEVLAYENQSHGKRQFTKRDFVQVARSVISRGAQDRDGKYLAILAEILFRSSLIRQTSQRFFEEYDFVHLSFQEFLCARRMTRAGLTEDDAARLVDDWWRNTYRFYFGLTGTMDSAPLPKRRQVKEGRRIGFALLELLAEAAFTGVEGRRRVHAILSHDLLHMREMVAAEEEVCRQVGDEIIDPLSQAVSERNFRGNTGNYFRALLALRSPRALFTLFSSRETILERLSANEALWLMQAVSSLVGDSYNDREFVRQLGKVLVKRAGSIGAGLTSSGALSARRNLQKSLATVESTLRKAALSADRHLERDHLAMVVETLREVRRSMT